MLSTLITIDQQTLFLESCIFQFFMIGMNSCHVDWSIVFEICMNLTSNNTEHVIFWGLKGK